MPVPIISVQLNGTPAAGAQVEVHSDGALHRAQHPLTPGELEGLIAEAEASYYTSKPGDLAQIGRHLYQTIDGPERCLSRYLQDLPVGTPIAVIAVSTYGPLHHLPWELLHDGQEFLVQRGYPTPVIVRSVPRKPISRRPQNRPLHTVFLAASPIDVEPALDLNYEEWRILKETTPGQHRLTVVNSGSLDELGDAISHASPGDVDVLHLTGHARHSNQGPYFLAEDFLGEARRAGADEIVRVLRHIPALVFLAGCRTGEASRHADHPSLAQQLVEKGVPAVLAWGRAVEDEAASTASGALYRELERGLAPAHALARAQLALLQAAPTGRSAGEQSEQPWHLLRLYTCLYPGSGIQQPLVTPLNAPKRKRLPRQPTGIRLLGRDQKVPVCAPQDFVGRRREAQRCLKVLYREIPESGGQLAGVVIHGPGGVGKSSLAYRVRMLAPDFGDVVVAGRLNEGSLIGALGNLRAPARLRSQLERSRDPLRDRLFRLLEGVGQLIIVLDNFEDNYKPESDWQGTGAPSAWDQPGASGTEPGSTRRAFSGDGEVRLSAKALLVLEDLVDALRQADRGHAIVITSRFPLNVLPDAFVNVPLARLPDPETRFKLRRLIGKNELPIAFQEHILEAADGNPLLLDTLVTLAQERHVVDDSTLGAMIALSESRFREEILAEELLSRLNPVQRQAVAAISVYRTPVSRQVLDELLGSAGIDLDLLCREAVFLGLLEQSGSPGSESYRVPAIFGTLLREFWPEDETGHARLAADALWQELERLELPPGPRREMYLQEVYRLSALSDQGKLLFESAKQLSAGWLDHSRFRTVVEFCAEVPHGDREPSLRFAQGSALAELGNMDEAERCFQAALAGVPPPAEGPLSDEANQVAVLRAKILNQMAFFRTSRRAPEEIEALLSEALELGERAGNYDVRSYALVQRAYCRAMAGRFDEAEELFGRALAVADDNPDEQERRSLRTGALVELAYSVYFPTGRTTQALHTLRETENTYHVLGSRINEAAVLHDMADIRFQLGELDTAKLLAVRSLEISSSEEIQGMRGLCGTQRLLADIYFAMPGYREKAVTMWDAALDAADLTGDRLVKAMLFSTRAAHEEDSATADGWWDAAVSLFEAVGYQYSLMGCLRSWASRRVGRGDHEGAVRLLRRALANTQNIADRAVVHKELAEALADWGTDHAAEAREMWEQAFSFYLEAGDYDGQAAAAWALTGLWRPEDTGKALEWLTHCKVIELRRENRSEVATLLFSEGLLWREQGDGPKAARAMQESVAMWEEMGEARWAAKGRLYLADWALADGLPHEVVDAHIERAKELTSSLTDLVPVGDLLMHLTKTLSQSADTRGLEDEGREFRSLSSRLEILLAPIVVAIGERLLPYCDPKAGGTLVDEIGREREELLRRTGFRLPPVRVTNELGIDADAYAVLTNGQVKATLRIPAPFAIAVPQSGSIPPGPLTREPGWPEPLAWISEEEVADRGLDAAELLTAAAIMARNIVAIQ